MQNIFLAFHIIVCVVLIILVLIQHGKGADQGLLSGGGSGSLFGAAGSTSMVVKVTGFFALLFFISSVTLGYYQSHKVHQVAHQIVAPGLVE
ncbi:MAG: preprotein translocase subunit SecG [Gammaproteobacteria bacterium]|jgi:preprotein translocase subunit SecG|nr:preprotein translocase subunit SecG [Gammaproteobacteria bacterium]